VTFIFGLWKEGQSILVPMIISVCIPSCVEAADLTSANKTCIINVLLYINFFAHNLNRKFYKWSRHPQFFCYYAIKFKGKNLRTIKFRCWTSYTAPDIRKVHVQLGQWSKSFKMGIKKAAMRINTSQ
jgi:hypothetical protein